MTAPMIVAGTTSDTRIYCQFWAHWTDPAKTVRTVEYAHMATDFGLKITADCPREWLELIWAAYLSILSGVTPTATHTTAYVWGNQTPQFTPIAPPAPAVDQLAFDLEGTPA